MSDRLVTIATFATGVEADLVQNVLENEGVRCYVADEMSVDLLWHVGGALGGVKLQVPESDAARAREILARYQAERTEAAESEAADSDQELEAPAAAPGDEAAFRAWRAAVIGLFLCPPVLHLYSAVLLASLALRGQPLSPAGTRRFYWAILLDVFVAVLTGLLIAHISK